MTLEYIFALIGLSTLACNIILTVFLVGYMNKRKVDAVYRSNIKESCGNQSNVDTDIVPPTEVLTEEAK